MAIDESDYADREAKDLPWQRMRKTAFDFKGKPFDPNSKHYLEFSEELKLEKPTLKDKNFYLSIDALIQHFKLLDRKQRDYSPKIEKKKLKHISRLFSERFKRLHPTSQKRLLLAFGKELFSAKGASNRLSSGNEALTKIIASIERAILRFERLPGGNRKLENARWLTKKLTTLLYLEKGITLSNSSRDYALERPGRKSNPGPRNLMRVIFAYSNFKISEEQLERIIRDEMKNRKLARSPYSEDSEDSDEADS